MANDDLQLAQIVRSTGVRCAGREVVKANRSALLCLVLLMILEVRYSKVSHTSIFLKR